MVLVNTGDKRLIEFTFSLSGRGWIEFEITDYKVDIGSCVKRDTKHHSNARCFLASALRY